MADFDLSNFDSQSLAGVSAGEDPTRIDSSFELSQDLKSLLWGSLNNIEREESVLDLDILRIKQTGEAHAQQYQMMSSYLQLRSTLRQRANIEKLIAQETKRVRLLKSRLRDGLILEDSLLLAQANLESFKLQLAEARSLILQWKKALELELERKIEEKDINIKQREIIFPELSFTETSELKILKKNIQKLSLQIKKQKLLSKPEISLSAGYRSSELSSSLSESFENGVFGSRFNIKTLSLNYVKAFDFDIQNDLKEQIKASQKVEEFNIKQQEQRYRIWIENFKQELEFLKAELESLKKRKFFLVKALKKREALFERGQREIDDVIDVVEMKSNVEIQIIRKELELDQRVLESMFTIGQIDRFLDHFKESE